MKHYFMDIQTGVKLCINEHRDGTATFRHKDLVNGRIKMVTKTYTSYRSAKVALGRYTGGWTIEIN